MEPVSRERLANLLGVSPRTVKARLTHAQVLPIRREGRVDLFDSEAAIRAILLPEASGEALDLAQERAALARAQREHYALRNAEATSKVVQIGVVEEVVGREYTAVRSRFRALPAALAPELANKDERHVQVILERAIDECLTELRGPAPRGTAGRQIQDAEAAAAPDGERVG